MCRSMRAMPGRTSRRPAAGACIGMGESRGGVSSSGMHANLMGMSSSPMRRTYSSALLDIGNGAKCPEGCLLEKGLQVPPTPRNIFFQELFQGYDITTNRLGVCEMHCV